MWAEDIKLDYIYMNILKKSIDFAAPFDFHITLRKFLKTRTHTDTHTSVSLKV